MDSVKLTWYGRCCFLIEINSKKILIDPHDHFDDIYMGEVAADYLLTSSVAHDHGNIAASVKAYTYGDAGIHELENDIIVTGISSKESRGSSNVIFNIQAGGLSITNFADWGEPESIQQFSKEELNVLQSTNIAFVRPNLILHEEGVRAGELALRVCNPQAMIIHHFYPESFITESGADVKMLAYLPQVSELISRISYKPVEIKEYSSDITLSKIKEKTAFTFAKIHPQVTHKPRQ